MNEQKRARIRERAYQLFLERGTRPGDALNDWLTAEDEIRDEEAAHRGPARIRHHWHRGILTDADGHDLENPT